MNIFFYYGVLKLIVSLVYNKFYLPLRFYFFDKYLIDSMNTTSEIKKEIFGKFGKSDTDTGSPESQVALFSHRILHLTEHLKVNKKDFSTQRSLLKMVGKRRRLLDYLKKRDIEKYRAIIKTLDLRK